MTDPTPTLADIGRTLGRLQAGETIPTPDLIAALTAAEAGWARDNLAVVTAYGQINTITQRHHDAITALTIERDRAKEYADEAARHGGIPEYAAGWKRYHEALCLAVDTLRGDSRGLTLIRVPAPTPAAGAGQ